MRRKIAVKINLVACLIKRQMRAAKNVQGCVAKKHQIYSEDRPCQSTMLILW